MDVPPQAAHRGESKHFPWRLLIVAGLIAFAMVAGVTAWFANRLFDRFNTGSIDRQFQEYIPTVGSADGILETATASVPETFTQTDSASLFNIIPLGTTVSEIRVRAVYRYHIRLYDPWSITAHGQVCVVNAPAFEASLPPAIDTGEMEKSTTAGWLRFNADENLETLEKGITGELNARANDSTHRNYAREACRRAVAEFVRRWLMKENVWREDRFHQIVVQFPDDPPILTESPPNPTLTIAAPEASP